MVSARRRKTSGEDQIKRMQEGVRFRMKLLVVEDELYAREALVRQIKKYDVTHVFEIYQAANGAEGWEICQKEDPELVLTDIRMPKMDGLQLLEQIRLD